MYKHKSLGQFLQIRILGQQIPSQCWFQDNHSFSIYVYYFRPSHIQHCPSSVSYFSETDREPQWQEVSYINCKTIIWKLIEKGVAGKAQFFLGYLFYVFSHPFVCPAVCYVFVCVQVLWIGHAFWTPLCTYPPSQIIVLMAGYCPVKFETWNKLAPILKM